MIRHLKERVTNRVARSHITQLRNDLSSYVGQLYHSPSTHADQREAVRDLRALSRVLVILRKECK